jgi:hypothetical protein
MEMVGSRIRLHRNGDDEQLLRGRVYGHDHDDPDRGPAPGQIYVEPTGGPLDGLAAPSLGRWCGVWVR